MARKLELSPRMFAVLRAIEQRQDAGYAFLGKNVTAACLEALKLRRLIMHTNISAEPWRLTSEGVELLRLKKLGDQRKQEQQRRALYGNRR